MFFYFFFHFSWTTELLCDTLMLTLRHPLSCPWLSVFSVARLFKIPWELCAHLTLLFSISSELFVHNGLIATPFAINGFRTLFHVMGRRGTLGSALCCLPLHSSCKFAPLFSIN